MKTSRFSIINTLFGRKQPDAPKVVLLGHTITQTRRTQYYALHFNESDNTFHVDQITRKEEWAMKAEFKGPETVIITVRGSISLISSVGTVMDVTGNLILKQSSPQDNLSIYGHGCGIRTTGSMTSEISHMAIHCSHGPAILSGGSIVMENISSLHFDASEPTVSIQDISLCAPPDTTAQILIKGGISAGGNVKIINGSNTPISSEQPPVPA